MASKLLLLWSAAAVRAGLIHVHHPGSSSPPSGSASSSEIHCFTAMGHKSAFFVPTTTDRHIKTVTLHDATITQTVTPSTTSTLDPETSTLTEIDTFTLTVTDSTVTDTFSTTSTLYISETDTETTTSTETEVLTTSTTTTSTSTVSAPAGFSPVQDTINGYTAARKRDPNPGPGCNRKKSSSSYPVATSSPAPSSPAPTTYAEGTSSPATSAPSSSSSASTSSTSSHLGVCTDYPQSVECKRTTFVQSTVTSTVSADTVTSTITPAPVTSTETDTVTTTSTLVPNDVTVTESYTDTSTTTFTETSTATVTATSTTTEEATATATVLGGCSADNILGPDFEGLGTIGNIYNNGAGQASLFTVTTVSSAYDCCAVCINSDICTASGYLSDGSCLLFHNSDSTCGAQSSSSGYYVYSSTTSGFTVSNGYCGYLYNGGQGY